MGQAAAKVSLRPLAPWRNRPKAARAMSKSAQRRRADCARCDLPYAGSVARGFGAKY